jgi:hypothetical protein
VGSNKLEHGGGVSTGDGTWNDGTRRCLIWRCLIWRHELTEKGRFLPLVGMTHEWEDNEVKVPSLFEPLHLALSITFTRWNCF